MKGRIILVLSVLFLWAGLDSCNVMDVTKEFTLELEFKAVNDQDNFNVGEELDAARANAYISDYGINIKKIEVMEVKYWVTSHSGPEDQLIKSADLIVADEDGNNPHVLGRVENESIQDLMSQERSMVLDQEGARRFAELVKSSPYKAKIYLNGDTDCSPLNFKLEFSFKVKMTASPI